MKKSQLFLILVFTQVLITCCSFLACKNNDNPLNSSEVMKWIQRESGTSEDLFDVTWNGTRFVAVGWEIILTSEEGKNWTQSPFPADYIEGNNPLKAVVWSQSLNLFLISGGDNAILTSPDGLSWTMKESGLVWGLIRSAASYDSLLLISYYNPVYLLTSSDGNNWTSQQDIGPFDDMASSDTLLIGVGQNCIYSSTNGVDWIQRHCGDSLIYCVTWNEKDSIWIAAGHLGYCLSSADGIVWTGLNSGAGDLSTLYDAFSSGGRSIIVGTANGPGLILMSEDSENWSKQVITSSSWLRGVTASPERYVIVGYDGVILSNL